MSEEYGRRLMCNVLRREAERDPDRLFTIGAKTNNVADGYHYITVQQVAKAVNFMAKWLQERFEGGSQPSSHPTLCYIGILDVRYTIIILAAIQCRYKVFVPSPRNTLAVNVSMLKQTECTRLVHARELTALVTGIRPAIEGLHSEIAPTVEELLNVPYTEYPYKHDFEQIHREPIMVLHSSGSTGTPKLVTWTHGTVAAVDFRDFPSVPGRQEHGLPGLRLAKIYYDPFPPFHTGGVLAKILTPVWSLAVPIYGPAMRPPSGELAAQIMRDLKPDGAALIPSVTEQLLHQPDGEMLFKSLQFVMFGGGPLSKQAGSKISTLTTLITAWGSTEAVYVRQLVASPEDWDHFEFHPDEHIELQPAGEGLFELVFKISKDFEREQAVYHNFPDLSEWRSQDLFERHPTKPNLWKFYGRLDDIIVFSNGQKLCPLPMEIALVGELGVKGALVVGKGHSQPVLLIEPSEEGKFESDDAVREALWPAVEAANALLPGYGRVTRSMIIVTHPDKPLSRAGKGTVIRRSSEELYAKEIEALFHSTVPLDAPQITAFLPSAFRIEDIKNVLRSVFQRVSLDSQMDENENVYSHGMDSIKTAEALSHVKTGLKAYRPGIQLDWLSLETFYTYPTISQLGQVLVSFLNDGITPAKGNRLDLLKAQIEKYSHDLPKCSPYQAREVATKGLSIAVIGTTGFLGGHLLNALLRVPHISQIYCLNRSSTARDDTNIQDRSDLHVEIIFKQYISGAPNLGLSTQDYALLANNCSLFLLNGWMVDFNLPVTEFEDNLHNVRSLINLSASATSRPRILFISSVATTGVWTSSDSTQQVVPEGLVEDLNTTIETGYAESKRVAEHVLDIASTQLGIPSTVVRVGHLVPDRGGVLTPNDLLTVFLLTSKELGMIAPDFISLIDWLRVDVAARIISDIVQHELNNSTLTSMSVFNVVNPAETKWMDVIGPVESWTGKPLKQTSMKEWVETLKRQESIDTTVTMKFPALRMLPMFDNVNGSGPMHRYEQRNLVAISPSMSELTGMDADTVSSWLQRL